MCLGVRVGAGIIEDVSGVLWRDRERGVGDGKVVCTDLAVEGAGVGDVFLGLFGIHWMNLVGSFGCRG